MMDKEADIDWMIFEKLGKSEVQNCTKIEKNEKRKMNVTR